MLLLFFVVEIQLKNATSLANISINIAINFCLTLGESNILLTVACGAKLCLA
ncbi:hypothetical protein NIAS840_01432 [Ligilactobacillus salivarius NIAS840]|uniref:Uncharacterized protein n=1 Tax=Ligilactobacillus salivarius NIAS840 TaxID=1029822 RepID=F5VC05_9LACO|nr:hypothetical protein NIAS840_01432 [Ligilactobacillus salivarius NIAS840]